MMELPSWVPDWSTYWQVERPFLRMKVISTLNLGEPGHDIKAAKDTAANVVFADDLKTVLVSGLIADIVDEVWPPLHRYQMTVDDEKQLQAEYRETALSWMQQQPTSIYHTVYDRISALFNSLTPMDDRPKIEKEREIWTARITRFGNWILNANKLENTLSDIDVTTVSRLTMTGKKDYIITGPGEASPGDLVCVLLGCDVPMILRQEGDHFILIGECYVEGMMHGEMIDAVNAGTLEMVEFLLH
ncbi:hypothetical protein ONS95_010879 [Cadophora gregata]|uniref:uncharacterized protein n=1 Tax=Cadophora gregata TaxID=51156 RepID=UPI0026DA8F7C|nr:uncharacterized protein ONS95_010879 [Cadophora gregata]KAK0119427.1 hypothetical protein ONS95_010879 [Cadophora gregata]KAK0120464.1 hypothetical protein ONS96_010678 [Cadophora gregata f. sp. sojae]